MLEDDTHRISAAHLLLKAQERGLYDDYETRTRLEILFPMFAFGEDTITESD